MGPLTDNAQLAPPAPAASRPAIEIHGISKALGGREVLSNVSFSVRTGSLFGLVGPNGAGKTTTLRCLLGLVSPTSGTIRVLGLDPTRDGRRVRSSTGVLLENDGLYDRLSAWRNLQYHARIHRLATTDARARAEQLLRAFGLWDRREDVVATWSKGMRQKLAIARALLHRPALALLDEPFSGLDPVAALDLQQQLRQLVAVEQVAVLMTTHDLHHVEKICDEVAIMAEGRVLRVGTVAELTVAAGLTRVRVAGEGLGEAVLEELLRAGLISRYEPSGEHVLLHCAPERADRLGAELIKRGVVLRHLAIVRSSLEEAFVSAVEGARNATGGRP